MLKKLRFFSIFAILSISVFLLLINHANKTKKLRIKYANFIKSSPYSKTKVLSKADLKKIPKEDRPDLAFEQDFLRTMDPSTGRPERKRLLKILNTDKSKGIVYKSSSTLNWQTRGPLQVGGRTRALMFDPNDATAKKVWAGGVDGGIWFNNDITDSLSVWQQASQNMANFSISSITYDPVNTQIFYLGTGEGYFNLDAVYGAGIWKSTDGGVNWSNLSATTKYEFIYDMVVRNEGGVGVLYAIVRDLQDTAGTEVMRSIDGGITFTLSSHEPFRDLELGSDNTLWAGDAVGGVWRSTNGTTWTKVFNAGTDTPSGGHLVATPRRVEIAIAPSDSKVVFALIADGSALGEVIVTLDDGATWIDVGEPSDSNDSTVPNNDFTRGQAWYDLIAAVDPTNKLGLYLGGINAFKLTNNGANYKKISSWHSQVDNSVSIVHADQHAFLFRPGHNKEAIMGNDGGVFYIPDVSVVENITNGIKKRNNGYIVTQFYSLAIEPNFTNGFLAGSQDNGTQYFNTTGISDTQDFSGGDGGFCFIDKTFTDANGGLYFIVSNTGNSYYLHDFSTTPNTYNIPIRSSSGGSFINAADYDDKNNILYSYDSIATATSTTVISKTILAADGANQGTQFSSTATTDDILTTTFGSVVSTIRVSPYNATNRMVFFGTQSSEVARMAPDKTMTMITPPTLVGSVSCIEVGANDNELLVTVSNYGVTSIFYTNDGGVTWSEKQGDLPDMPVRWALFNPLNRSEVLLATEVGVWKTLDISAASPGWVKANTGMGNVRVDMLQYRASDNVIAAATHGRGLFTSSDLTLDVKDNNLSTKSSSIKIYPTVSDGNFNIFSRVNSNNTKLSAYDINGRLVFSKSLDLINGGEKAINTTLKSGVYILNLKGDNINTSNKIIIK